MRPLSLIAPTLVAVVVAVAALLLSHGSASTASTGGAAGNSASIDISNFLYSPAVDTVKVGTTVLITNKDSTEHTATSDTEGVFDTGTLNQGQSAHITLSKVGTYSFHCSFHAFMHGTLKVVPR